MKLLPRLLATQGCLTKLTVVLFAAVFAFGAGQTATAQSSGMGGMGGMGDVGGTAKDAPTAAAQSGDSMGGLGQGMAKEDPIPFTRDIEQAAADILSQLKAGRAMDARNSVSRLTTATDKLAPHITGDALKKRLTAAVDGIKTMAGERSPDLLDLEDKVDALQVITEEVREALQNMN
jgi:hypothetical protein